MTAASGRSWSRTRARRRPTSAAGILLGPRRRRGRTCARAENDRATRPTATSSMPAACCAPTSWTRRATRSASTTRTRAARRSRRRPTSTWPTTRTGLYLIVSLAGEPEVRAWRIADGRSPRRRSRSMTTPAGAQPLACPSCALRYGLDERFCARCGMPLVYVGRDPVEAPASDAHGRARKIDPRYTEGELVRVAGGRNQAEAELIQGMLLEEGVPSILRRSAGLRRARLPGRRPARRAGAERRCRGGARGAAGGRPGAAGRRVGEPARAGRARPRGSRSRSPAAAR